VDITFLCKVGKDMRSGRKGRLSARSLCALRRNCAGSHQLFGVESKINMLGNRIVLLHDESYCGIVDLEASSLRCRTRPFWVTSKCTGYPTPMITYPDIASSFTDQTPYGEQDGLVLPRGKQCLWLKRDEANRLPIPFRKSTSLVTWMSQRLLRTRIY
jgi:hypothetical protein